MSVSSRSKNKAKSETLIFGLIMLLLGIAMAIAIFLKQRSVTPDLSFWNVLVWQIVLWTPLTFAFPSLKWAIKHNKNLFFWIVSAFLFLGLHYGWFVGVSSVISPYLEYPRTRYGVYPFFFIFWTLIDIFLITGLLIFLISQSKKLETDQDSLESSLYVKKGNKGVLLKPEDIYWIGADDYYSDIHSSKGRFLERKSLKALLDHLPADKFMRIHRSTVINTQAIHEFRPVSGLKAEVKLIDGNTRKVSRTYLKQLKELLAKARV